jgi:hypothetical protein
MLARSLQDVGDTAPLQAELQLGAAETELEVRVFVDRFIGEAYFQQGREVFTFDAPPTEEAGMYLRAQALGGGAGGGGQEEGDQEGDDDEGRREDARGTRGGGEVEASVTVWSLGSIYISEAELLASIARV